MRASLLLGLLLLSACTGNDAFQSQTVLDASTTEQQSAEHAADADLSSLEPPALAETAPPQPSLQKVAADRLSPPVSVSLPLEAVTNRMVIRNAEIRLTVASAESAAVAITNLAETRGGYVTESRQWREGDALRAFLTLRVPAERLSETLTAIRAVAVRVENESVNGQDVTAEYTDLSAQLTNLETAETELRELLSTTRERSQRASDILEVYNQLTHIRGEVERTKGRMQYLSQMTAYSTVQVDLYRDQIAEPLVAAGWRPLLAVREAGSQLVYTLQDVAEFGIWLAVYVLPLLALIGLPLYVLYRLLRPRLPRYRHVVSSELDG